MLHFKTTSSAFLIFAFSITATVVQADYQHQVSFSKTETAINDSAGTTLEADIIGYSYFLAKVATNKGPWAETPFINRNAYIDFQTYRTKYSTVRSNIHIIGGTYSNSDSPLVFSAHYLDSESDHSGIGTSDTTGYGISLGYYVTNYTLLGIGHTKSKKVYSFLPEANNYDSTNTTISAKTLLLRGDAAISLSGFYSNTEHSDGDEFKYLTLTGTYYVNPRLGVGGEYTKRSDNFGLNNGKRFGVHAQYFINPSFSISTTASKYSSDDSPTSDSRTISLGGTAYF